MTTSENPRSEWTIRRALLGKEWAESRPAIIAGVAIFLGLPAIWTFVYAACVRQYEIFPLWATVLLMLGGWLYSAVVAAQIVCRDFGRRQGEFLLARPVTSANVLGAKITVGFGIVLGLVVLVGIWEAILARCASSSIDNDPPWHLLLGASVACLIAFWVALAAAAVTRQTLSGVMIAGLVLVLLLTVPLMTRWPARTVERIGHLGAAGFRLSHSDAALVADSAVVVAIPLWFVFALLRFRPLRLSAPSALSLVCLIGLCLTGFYTLLRLNPWPLIAVVAVTIAALVLRAVALLACRSRHVLRMGTKSIAWTIGVTMMLICGLAMTEVGANVPVSFTVWWPQHSELHRQAIGNQRIACLRRGPVSFYDPRSPLSPSDAVVLYDLTDAGMIVRPPRHLWLAAKTTRDDEKPSGAILVLDSADRLFILQTFLQDTHRVLNDGTPRWRGVQTVLHRVNWDDGAVEATVELQRPPEIREDESAVATDAAIEGDRLFVVCEYRPLRTPDAGYAITQVALVVYRLDGSGAPSLERTHGLAYGSWLKRGADGRLYVVGVAWPVPVSQIRGDGGAPDTRPAFFAGEDATDYWRWDGRTVIKPDVLAEASQARFSVFELSEERNAAGHSPYWSPRLVGEIRASPWAWLFRSPRPTLVAAGHDRVWEIHDTSAICYDVSDPQHPRRIAHVSTYPISSAVAGPRFLVLNHDGAGLSIVKNPE